MTSYEDAIQYALRILSARSYLTKEIRDKLKRREVESEVIERVMNRLDALGYLNDSEFIAGFVRSRISRREGPYKIRRKLQGKGCAQEDIDLALATYSREQQYDNLVAIITAKQRLPKQKLINHCRTRGYFYDLISEVITDLDIQFF